MLESIALFLTNNYIKCQIFGFSIDDYENLPNMQTAIVYLSVGDISHFEVIKDFMAALKAQGVRLLVGGHFCISIKALDIFHRYESIDIIIRYPSAEYALLDTIKALTEKTDLKNVKGITFRECHDKNGIVHTKRDKMPPNIDHLESPLEKDGGNGHWQSIIISIGCHNDCQYCIGQVPYKNDLFNPNDFWRKKSELKIVDEIQSFMDQGIDSFHFYCDEFFGVSDENKQFVSNLVKEILKRNLKIRFRVSAKPRNIRDNLEIFPMLLESGLHEINIGIDSGLERFHRVYKTGSTLADVLSVLGFLHSQRLAFDVTFIFYDPFLNLVEIKENLCFLREIYPFFSALPFPYSRYLDSRILNSALILRYGMPIIDELERSNLILESPGFPANPGYRFLNNETLLVYSGYSYVNKSVLTKIRHFFYDKELVTYFNNSFELFPLIVMEKIVHWVENEKTEDLGKIVAGIERFTKDFFGPLIDNIGDAFPKYKNPALSSWLKQ